VIIVSFQNLSKALCCSIRSPLVLDLLGNDISALTRNEYYGTIARKAIGLELVFQDAGWLKIKGDIDPRELYLVAFHFHRSGHEGYSGFSGSLPKGVALGDLRADILEKMGHPDAVGGGEYSSIFKRKLPYWVRYSVDNHELQFQLDSEERLEMVTLNGSCEFRSQR
jgi:hypothetical protein